MNLPREPVNGDRTEWTHRCALELHRLWPALPFADAIDIATELWAVDGDAVDPETAAREEIATYRRLTR